MHCVLKNNHSQPKSPRDNFANHLLKTDILEGNKKLESKAKLALERGNLLIFKMKSLQERTT